MKPLLKSAAIVAVGIAVSGCNPFPEKRQWNQKLTVVVETPEG